MNLRPPALVLVALVGIAGIIGQWAGPNSFPWWRVLAALLVLGLLYEWLRVRSYRVTAHPQLHALHLGRDEELGVGFQNAENTDIVLQFVPGLPDPIRGPGAIIPLQISAGGQQHTRFPVQALELGAHPWPRLPTRIRGPLGLAWWSVRCDTNSIVRVQPDTLGQRGHVLGTMRGGSAQQSIVGAGRELHHLRDYQPGDPRHTIDWKASARKAELVTRVFSEDQHLEIMLLIDVGRTCRTQIDGMSQLGHYVNLAARFAEYAALNEDDVGLLAFADRKVSVVPPGRGSATVTRIRRALTGLTPQAVESDVLNAALELRRVVRHRCLVILLSDLYEGTANNQLSQAIRLWVPKHLPVIVGLTGADIRQRLSMRANSWLDPFKSLAAREYQQHLDSGVQSLRRLGAHPIVARSQDLDDRVFDHYRLLKAQRRV